MDSSDSIKSRRNVTNGTQFTFYLLTLNLSILIRIQHEGTK